MLGAIALLGGLATPVAEALSQEAAQQESSSPEAKPEPEPAASVEPAEGKAAEAAEAPASEPIQVDVSGSRRAAAPKAGGDFDLVIGQLIDVPRGRAERLLTLAPGLVLANHGGEGHPSVIFLRGFDAGEGQDMEMRVEGVPINEPSHPHGHGYADTNFLIPALIERVRVIEGPFDVSQGDFAVAGSAVFELGLPSRGVIARAAYGSFHRAELSVLWGPHGFDEDTFFGVELVRGDGFGRNRAHQAVRGMAQISHSFDDDTKLKVFGTSYATRFDSAGVVRADDVTRGRIPGCGADFDEQFFCTYDANQGGATQRHGLSATLEHKGSLGKLEASAFTTYKDTRMRENFTGFVLDRQSDGSPQRGDGSEQIQESITVGMRGKYVTNFELFDQTHDVEVGLTARYDTFDSILNRLRTADGVPYRSDFDRQVGTTNLGAYGGLRFQPLDFLVVRGGLRLDSFVFGLEDRNVPEVDRTGERLPTNRREAFGIAPQPRATVTLIPLPWLSWMTSLGLGTRSSDSQALSDGESAPFANVIATETGLVAREATPSRAAEARLLAFATRVTSDLVFDEQAGRNVPIGPSNRYGVTAFGRLTDTALGLDAATSFSFSEAFISAEDETIFDVGLGPRLPFVPRWVARVDLSERYPFEILGEKLRVTGALGLLFVDQRPLPLEQFGAPVFSVDAAVKLKWRLAELGVEAQNLLDRRNREAELYYPSNFAEPAAPASQLAARHWVAGQPQTFLGTLTLHFDARETSP